MSEELPIVAPVCYGPIEVVLPPEAVAPVSVDSLTTPSPEHARAVEAAFTKDEESHLAAGLLGLWTGTLLLHDLAKEHFETEEDDERVPRREDRSHP